MLAVVREIFKTGVFDNNITLFNLSVEQEEYNIDLSNITNVEEELA